MSEPKPVREGRERAELVRLQHELGTAPVRDLFGFVDRAFTDVWVIRKPIENGPVGALMSAASRWVVVVNTWDAYLMRQRFTLCHELGHHLTDGHERLVVEHSLFGSGVAETRANAFAVHFLLPVDVLKTRQADGSFDPGDEESLVLLSMEYGISIRSLAWHLKNAGLASDARRRWMTTIKPFEVARRLGLQDRVKQEIEAKSATRWPRSYVSLATRAHDRGQISKDELTRMLGDDVFVQSLFDTVEMFEEA
jgi:Zn-dependent peptidase ImmA (M78 family)